MPDKAWTGELDTSDPTGIAPRGNEPYTQPEYWEWRFQREQQNDWLVSGAAAVEVITPLLPPASTHPRVLLVGTGNSSLPAQLYEAGWTNLVATDIAASAIDAMQARYGDSHPGIAWECADMLALVAQYGRHAFDAVVDKAAMDALLAHGGDTWHPPQELLDLGWTAALQSWAVLKPGAVYVQLSFGLPHLRAQYLQPPAAWAAEQLGVPASALPAVEMAQLEVPAAPEASLASSTEAPVPAPQSTASAAPDDTPAGAAGLFDAGVDTDDEFEPDAPVQSAATPPQPVLWLMQHADLPVGFGYSIYSAHRAACGYDE